MGPILKRCLLLAVGTVVTLALFYLALAGLMGAFLIWIVPNNGYAPLVPRPEGPIVFTAIGIAALALGIASVGLFSRWTAR